MTTYEGNFFQFNTIIEKDAHLDYWSIVDSNKKLDEQPEIYLEINIYRAQFTQINERDKYNALDFLGDLGGVSGIFVSVIGFFLYPYSRYAYNLKMTKKLFKARTRNDSLFGK